MTYQVIHIYDQGGCFGPIRYEVKSEHSDLDEAEISLWIQRQLHWRDMFDYTIKEVKEN